ncbi:hypothetical protein [Jeotgalibacillus marinus]|uniref:Uncharacterized protein n=1 Tax=Jeotgalibacillus marinus TaxID=86667 RepID=A0ABV3Q6N5_9BACL
MVGTLLQLREWVHLTDGDRVAVFSTEWIYLLKDAGATFDLIKGSEGRTAVTYTVEESFYAAAQQSYEYNFQESIIVEQGEIEGLADSILYLPVNPWQRLETEQSIFL